MKSLRRAVLAFILPLTIFCAAQSSPGTASASASSRQSLVGAWHLVAIAEQAADGTTTRRTDLKGILIYTPDGHISVQVMYPPSDAALSNDYVQNGYEASFGTFDVDEAAHTVTHHVQASLTHGLVGKDLPRHFELSGPHLILRSTNPDEHWSVTWKR